MDRRKFLDTSLWAVLACAAASAGRAQSRPRSPRILLCSAWQTINIGDIAHTPGMLSLLEHHLPAAEVYLWPLDVGSGVREMLLHRFPRLRIIEDEATLQDAFSACDFLLHGSGANLVVQKRIEQWSQETGKPYGILGITFPPQNSSSTKPTGRASLDRTVAVFNKADFIYFRDRGSLAFARSLGATCPVMDFGPDVAFACDVRDDARAEQFLKAHGLETERFLCCIPRLRYSPYWMIPSKNKSLEPAKHARNEAMKEHDHAPLRLAIEQVVEATDFKILLCPEDETQMAVGKEMILDRLAPKIAERVVWRETFWRTDEAISTFVRSAGLFANDLHSAIMCIGHGIPAIVCSWAEQTPKAWMWNDIGMNDWFFNFDDEADIKRLPSTVLEVATNPAAARHTAHLARAKVESIHAQAMANLHGKFTFAR